jgi:hypothetical protein
LHFEDEAANVVRREIAVDGEEEEEEEENMQLCSEHSS